MDLNELKAEYRKLEVNARDVSLAIGQHEAKLDHALESLKSAIPDLDISDPRAINFDKLMKDTIKEQNKLSSQLESELEVLRERIEKANDGLQKLIGN
jgi:uncharacterized phage infection (PIP) family protein YhgE